MLNFGKNSNSENKPKKNYVSSLSFVLVGLSLILLFISPLSEKIVAPISSKVSMFADVVSSVLALETNNFRLSNNEQTLSVSDLLTKAAQMKADDMAAKGYFSHTGPLGEQPWVWFDVVGYKYSYAGENLAVDYTESADVTEGWINSAKHKANLLNKNFTEIGIGVSKGVYEGHNTTFVVQFFAKPFIEQIVKDIVVVKKDAPIIKEVKSNLSTSTTLVSVPANTAVATTPDVPLGEVLGVESENASQLDSRLYYFSIIGLIIFLIIVRFVVVRSNKKNIITQ